MAEQVARDHAVHHVQHRRRVPPPSAAVPGRRRLLADLLMAELPKNYPGTEGCFVLNTAGDVIELSQPTACTIITADGTSYSGTLDELRVSVQGARITIQGQTTVKVSAGIQSRCRAFSSHTFSLVNLGEDRKFKRPFSRPRPPGYDT